MAYGGNRSILFNASAKIPVKALRHCIGLALTYHARKSPARKRAAKGKAASAGKTAALRLRARPS